MKDYPTDKVSYWKIVDANWSNLINIISRFASDKVKEAEQLRVKEDAAIVNIFEETWGRAPDSSYIHYIPSWHVLCDLCSESYVLFDEEGKPL